MASYLQMGHHTENLVGETGLEAFTGVILSPLNRRLEEHQSDVTSFRERGIRDIVFDPQLYYPHTVFNQLREHSYFPDDLDTADTTDMRWWSTINESLVQHIADIGADTIISPGIEPRVFNDDYYAICINTADDLRQKASPSIKCLVTVMVDTKQLSNSDMSLRIASLVSETECEGYYLVFILDQPPRREMDDYPVILGMLRLIKELRNTKKPIWVSFSGSDMLLFKFAGADNCCTGKFFNLRRFSPSRFDLPPGGGGQLAYWFEHSLMAFLREQDVLLLQSEEYENLLSTEASDNHWSEKILDLLEKGTGTAWLGIGWRQYLSWFCQTESELQNSGDRKILDWLRQAESNWRELDDNDILFEESRNDGSWIRPWRQALTRLQRH